MVQRRRRVGFTRWLGILAGGVVCVAAVRAHDYWVDAGTLRPHPEEELSVWVTGGHRFPEVELPLNPRLLRDVSLVTADRDRTAIEVHVGEDRRHLGLVTVPDEPGAYLLEMTIQHPRQERPRYMGRAILVTPGAKTGPSDYAIGHGLEIVPETSLDKFPADGELPLSVLKNGESRSATLTVYPSGERPVVARAAEDHPARIAIDPGRKYLVVSAVDRIPVSLVFSVGEKLPAGNDNP